MSTVSAQAPPTNAGELMIGTVPVRLGAKKDVVLGALGKQYKLDEVGQVVAGVWLWTARESDAPKQIVGTVQFKQDRLVNAGREWGEMEADSALVSFFQKVYGAFNSGISVTNAGTLNCTVSRKPDNTLTVLTFTFGSRRVNLTLSEARVLGEPWNAIQVDESVRLPGIP
jgi:hypothetical protein